MASTSLELTNSLKALFIETAKQLKGTHRRQFMAKVVKELGIGGQTRAEQELGWNRGTIRKGMQELTSGLPIEDAFGRRGRKRVESRLPKLAEDIRAIVDPFTQADPSLRSERLYTRISAPEVRRQLIEQKGYDDEELPTSEVIRQRLNEMNYCLRRVIKAKPQKKIPETDAIFEQVGRVNAEADADESTLRISIDAKATVNIGDYDRGEKSRVPTLAADHDFKPTQTLTPVGIYLPQYDRLYLFFVTSKVTADCLVDLLEQWWNDIKVEFPQIQKWVINLDNGPENQSRRTQFMFRLVQWVNLEHIPLQLAYYPPYHSKYNPVERTFGWLEQHWNGDLLDSVETVLNFAATLTFKGHHPVVKLITQIYETGVSLSTRAMDELEKQWQRLPGLEKWFVQIPVTATT